MKRRTGATLIEVLVAIFVMGLGLIALLTLFPIGALRMAQSILDDRCALAGQNAFAMAVIQNIKTDPLVISQMTVSATDPVPIPDMFSNPHPKGAPGVPALKYADPYSESYSVFVDPIGYYSVPAATPGQDWVGGSRGVLRRRPVAFVGTVPVALRNLNILKSFTFWDDINFDQTQSPAGPQTAPAPSTRIFRDARFSWAYLLRRRQSLQAAAIDCTVVVFDRRPLSLSGTLTLEEYVYPAANATFDPSSSTVTLTYGGALLPPPVKAGSWILDATIFHATATTATQHAYFYRVVSVEDISNNSIRVEVQATIKSAPPQLFAPGAAFPGTAIVFNGIAQVYDKGPLRSTP